MKKFFSGFLCAALIFSLAVSALAITGRMTIEVDPINIQVNGETFVPKDVNGVEVPVFAYNGTTYAPLRALAEAYGLEVGYDATSNMATVADPDANTAPVEDTKATFSNDRHVFDYSYEEFVELWAPTEIDDEVVAFMAQSDDAVLWWNSAPTGVADECAHKIASEYQASYYTFMGKHGELLHTIGY